MVDQGFEGTTSDGVMQRVGGSTGATRRAINKKDNEHGLLGQVRKN